MEKESKKRWKNDGHQKLRAKKRTAFPGQSQRSRSSQPLTGPSHFRDLVISEHRKHTDESRATQQKVL